MVSAQPFAEMLKVGQKRERKMEESKGDNPLWISVYTEQNWCIKALKHTRILGASSRDLPTQPLSRPDSLSMCAHMPGRISAKARHLPVSL